MTGSRLRLLVRTRIQLPASARRNRQAQRAKSRIEILEAHNPMRTTWSSLVLAYAGAFALAYAADVPAQAYPIKPVRLIVPFVPGGGADAAARLFGAKLGESVGQQIIIDNRGGAGGTIGAELAAKSAPDGYTLLLGTANLAMNVSLYGKRPYDPVKDFVTVSLLSSTPNVIAVHPSLPVKTVRDLIAFAKAHPGQINYASGGNGSTAHLAAELFKTMAQVSLVHVPYKGSGPATIAVLSGESPLTMVPALAVMPHVQSGRLRALAISSVRRADALPDLPTVAESGLPGYEASQWYGVMVPTGTPENIVTRLNAELVKIVHSPDMTARLAAEASIPFGSTPQQFAAYLQEEIVKWARVVKFSGAKLD
jgi:tripartite-type tricarboxylate transporter receptor subunit TctC